MPSSEYPDAVLEYVQAQGWTANLTELRNGAYILAGTRETDTGSEKMLLMSVCEPENEVSSEHIEYLLRAGREKNADSVLLTHTVGITEKAREMSKEYDIGLVDSERVRSQIESSGFDIDTNEIQMPDFNSGSKSGSSTDQRTKGANPIDSQIYEIEANYTQSEGQSIGGTLILSENSLLFEPNTVVRSNGGEETKISFDEIQSLGRQKKFSRGLKDTLFGGGLKDRLRIETNNGSEFLFVVSDIDDVKEKIRGLMHSEQVQNQSPNAHLPKQDQQSEEPTTLTLGLAASWIIGTITLYVGGELFWSQGRLSGLLYLTAGAIVVPYTRKYVESFVDVKFGRWFLVAAWVVICFVAAVMYAATPT